ncbi:MAG: hypothetical protein LBU61_06115, partial [Coriobacteriales bacterium]|nr:hypothetical protein [Coriobacteriales bacterium]
RRAWIHFQVVDDSGKLLFESGGYDDQGMIYDNDADITKGAFEPHYTIINQPGQVQIYESIMLDSNGQATTNLLQGVTYGKDNRLLPLGTNKAILQGDAMVVGEAFDDADFIGGRDIVRYQINLPAGTSNVTVKVELLYQSVGYRFMDDLMSDLSTEQQTLAKLIEQHPNLPVVVTSKEMSITR